MTGMREELKKALQDRVGLDEPTSERVVEVVVAYFKEKVLSLLSGSGRLDLLRRSAI
jgi:hypothetical protein